MAQGVSPWSRLGNPLAWSTPYRCLAIAVIVGTSTAIFLLSILAGGWPFLPFPADDAPLLPALVSTALALWMTIGVAAWRLGRRGDSSRILAGATVWLYAVAMAGFTLVTGPFAAPGWVAYVGGAVVGYVLFSRTLAVAGAVIYLVVVIVGACVLSSGGAGAVVPPTAIVGLDAAEIARGTTGAVTLSTVTFAVIAFVVDRWRDREARYQHLASTDGLTGLVNRRHFVELAERELHRARRHEAPLALALLDLDHFKRVNDQHGHQVGDQVLAAVARVLLESVRAFDVVARWGGEELAILLPATDAVGAREVAERCARNIAELRVPLADGGAVSLTASLGVATFTGVDGLDELLRRADTALYRAKDGGRNRVESA